MTLRRHSDPRRRPRRKPAFSALVLFVAIANLAFMADAVNSQAVESRVGLVPAWEFLDLSSRGEAIPRALAQQAVVDRFALADSEGVSILRGGRRDRAALEGVADLAFDRDGTLWIGAESGLYRWAPGKRLERRPLRGGESANRVLRLATNDSGILVGTDAGAFWSSAGRVFQDLSVDGAAMAVSLVAMEGRGGPSSSLSAPIGEPRIERCWVLRGGELFELRGIVTDAGFRLVGASRLTMPRMGDGQEPIDLRVDVASAELLLIFQDVVAVQSIANDPVGHRTRRWRIERPVLPPAAAIRRLARGMNGRTLIATDHGLLEGPGWSGPFIRSTQPLGSSECVDVQIDVQVDVRQGGGEALVALCHRGVYLRRSLTSQPTASNPDRADALAGRRAVPSLVQIEVDPPLPEIRARAIRRSGLSVERYAELRDGLSRRAYWPEFSLRVGADFDRDRQTDRDQSYVSGDTRNLLDRRNGRELGIGVSLQFDWDLGGVAYPEDSVDLSRELRLVLSLRDDVSDEINQLYFERQGIRERIAMNVLLDPTDPTEAMRLRLRAAEIEAGLDAWTGGWISLWRADRARERGGLVDDSMRVGESP